MHVRTFVIAVTLLLPAVFAKDEVTVWQRLGIMDPMYVLTISAILSGLFVIISVLYQNGMGAQAKRATFIFISVPVLIGTAYLGGSTVYLNTASATGGPVHWHADYEIWACGEKYELIDPTNFDSKVGTPTVHEHNDNRIHIEGVLLELEDASLGKFFENVGGEFSGKRLVIPTNNGQMSWENNELCNGQPAKWHVFVNGQPSEEMESHILAPYADVPPGDLIKLVFSEKPLSSIKTELGVEP